MVNALENLGPPSGQPVLHFGSAARSVFEVTLFIEEAELAPAGQPFSLPARRRLDWASTCGTMIPTSQWQAAVGRRLLTAQEEAARQRYFEHKCRLSLMRSRLRLAS